MTRSPSGILHNCVRPKIIFQITNKAEYKARRAWYPKLQIIPGQLDRLLQDISFCFKKYGFAN